VKQRRHQLRLSGAAVADNANVSDVLSGIRFHRNLLKCSPTRGEQRGPTTERLARACAGVRASVEQVLREESVALVAQPDEG